MHNKKRTMATDTSRMGVPAVPAIVGRIATTVMFIREETNKLT